VTDHAIRAQRYLEWLHAQNLRFGFALELSSLADRVSKGVRNDTPPVERWHRILPTIRLVESVREAFGPTILNSAYRSMTYNIAVGGVGDSRHSQNDALDISVVGVLPQQVADFLKEQRAKGAFSGGIGVYRTFVHVDTRGTNADWRGK
jgi:uncharacterized protein YcbK (DUF882 family)